jgi:isopenicillin-N epimerase
MKDYKSLFLLNPEVTFLNHGSFGACPKQVFEAYQRWQVALEFEPVQFITKIGVTAYQKSKEVFAEEFSCNTDDFFFTTNPSTAFNTVIKSLPLKAGDEILSTDLEYGAMDRTWNYYCKQSGAKYIQQNIPLPIQSTEHFLEAFWQGLTSNTKYIFLSHITSSTGLILPVEEICNKAKALGLITIIDGAHVPGHIPLNLGTIQADYYTGALHKWYLAPKGLSFLHIKKEFQSSLDPLIVSWGYQSDTPSHSQFLDYHEYNGTRDFSAYLTMPALKEFWMQHDWLSVTNSAKEMILHWYPKFCTLLKTKPICPVNPLFLAQMCSIPIKTSKPLELKELLYEVYKIEIPITNRGKEYFIRLSIQGYTNEEEVQYLYDSLAEILREGIYLK